MDDALDLVWHRAELPNHVLSTAEIAQWQPDQRQAMIALGLLRRTSDATAVMCEDCGPPHPAEIIRDPRKPQQPYYVCPEIGRVQLAPSDLQRWKADFGQIAVLIRRAIGLTAKSATLVPSSIQALGPRLVILDTFTALVKTGSKVGSDVFRSQYAEVSCLRTLAQDFRTAIIVVHHMRKGISDGAIEAGAGTGGIATAVDTLWQLKRKSEGEATLDIVGRERRTIVLLVETFAPDETSCFFPPAEGILQTHQRMAAYLQRNRGHRAAIAPAEPFTADNASLLITPGNLRIHRPLTQEVSSRTVLPPYVKSVPFGVIAHTCCLRGLSENRRTLSAPSA